MQTTHFAIEDASGNPMVSAHANDSNRSVVYLYAAREQAEESVGDSEDSSLWRVAEVNQQEWLGRMLTDGYTDVCDGIRESDIRYLLTSLRAISYGRNLLGG